MGMGQLVAKMIIELATGSILNHFEDDERVLLIPLASVCSQYKILGQVLRMLLFREKPDQEILFDIDELVDDEKIKKSH